MTLLVWGGVTPQQASNLLMQHFSEEKKKKKKKKAEPLPAKHTHTHKEILIKNRTFETKTHVLFQSGYNSLRAV